jgi:protein phosphatase
VDYMLYKASIRTEINKRRDNQDFAACFHYISSSGNPIFCCLLSDGMGGLKNGKLASSTAIGAACAKVMERLPFAEGNLPFMSVAEAAVDAANEAVLEMCLKTGESGGATLALAICLQNGSCFCANAGDSKILAFSKKSFALLSRSHSLAQQLADKGAIGEKEARTDARKNQLVEYIGKQDLSFASAHRALNPGDRLLLLSDGAFSSFSDAEVFSLLSPVPSASWADKLFSAARAQGEEDNQTMALVECLKENRSFGLLRKRNKR